MTDQKVPISTLPVTLALDGTELLPVVQTGTTVQTLISAIKTYIAAVIGPVSSTDKAIARYSGTSGNTIQDYTSNPPTITDTGQVFIGPSSIPTVGTAFNTYTTDLNSNVVINSFQAAGAANAAVNVQALNFSVTDTGTANIATLTGVNGLAIKSGSGTITTLTGINASPRIVGTVVATSFFCFGGQPRVANGCSATTVVTFNAAAATIGATAAVTSAYGVKVASQKVTGVTTGYGVASDGASDLNYFLGSTGMGVSAPTAYTHCAAGTTAKASLRIATGVAPTTPNDGDMWQDGTNLKIQIGGVTKIII